MADPTIDNILEKRAAFATNFLGTTNLAQRRRYQEDIAAAKDNRAETADRKYSAAYERAALADPLKAEALRMSGQRLEQGAEQFSTREERLNQGLDLRSRAYEEKAAHNLLTETTADLKLQESALSKMHTAALLREEFDLRKRAKMGTEAYANGAGELAKKYEYADKAILQNLFTKAGIDMTPEQAAAEQARLEELGLKTRMTWKKDANGRPSYGLTEVNPPSAKAADPLIQAQRQGSLYDKAVQRYNAEGDPEFKLFLEKQIHELRKGMETPPASIDGKSATKPVPASTSDGKQIDAETASSILKEAGGDRDKARLIAKERGYTF